MDDWVAWATVINAGAFIVYLINEFRNGRFMRTRARETDTKSVYDDYWLQNICFPVCVTPLIELGHQLSDAVDECSSIETPRELDQHLESLSVDLYRRKNAILSSSAILTIFDQNHPQFFSDGFDEVEEALAPFMELVSEDFGEISPELVFKTQVDIWKGVRNTIRMAIQSHITEKMPDYLERKSQASP